MANARNILYVLAASIPGLLKPALFVLALLTMPVGAANDFPVAPPDASATKFCPQSKT